MKNNHGIEFADQFHHGSEEIRKILEFAKEEGRIDKELEKYGIRTLYSVLERDEGVSRRIKIQEKNGTYNLMVNGKNQHSCRNFDECMAWGRSAGYINKSESIRKPTSTRKINTPVPKTAAPAKKPAPVVTKKPEPKQRLQIDPSWAITGSAGWIG